MADMMAGLGTILNIVLNMLQFIILASVVVSWVGADPGNPIVQTINRLTEPLFAPFRKVTQKLNTPFDFSPLIVMLIIIFVQRAFVVPMMR